MNIENSKPEHNTGYILKQARIALGLSIANVVEATRIRPSHVEAIENNDYSKLPEKTYALGYVVSYAKFLKLDHKQLLIQAKAEYTLYDPSYDNMIQNKRLDKQYNPMLIIRNNIIDFFIILFTAGRYKMGNDEQGSSVVVKNNNKVLSITILIVFFVILIVIIGGYYFAYKKPTIMVGESPVEINSKVANALNLSDNKNDNNAENNKIKQIINQDSVIVIDKNSNTNTTPNNETNTTVNNKLAQKNTLEVNNLKKAVTITAWPASNSNKSLVTLNFRDRVWVTIYNAQNPSVVYLDAIYNKGDTFSVPNIPDLMMDVGNYHGVILQTQGKNLQLISSNSGNVLNKINLNSNNLLTTYQGQ